MSSHPPISNPQPQPPPISSGNSSFVHNIISYDNNIMLAAIISLLLVILFVLLLHVYAKWFLVQAARRGGGQGAGSTPHVMLSARFHHHLHTFSVGIATPTSTSTPASASSSTSKGLEASVICTIPQFVYKSDERQQGLECVICLSVFQDEEIGRKLTKCEHAFHVECIDMWLHSHTTCPVCRGPAICDNKLKNVSVVEVGGHDQGVSEADLEELEIVVVAGTTESIENVATNDTSSDNSSSSEVPNSIGASLKRMMSRNKCVGKIYPSRNVTEQTNER